MEKDDILILYVFTYQCGKCDYFENLGCPGDIIAPDSILCPECREGGMHQTVLADSIPINGYFRVGTSDAVIQKLERRRQSALLAMKPGTKDGTEQQARLEINAYYDAQIRLVRDGRHPSFPPGYVIVVRND